MATSHVNVEDLKANNEYSGNKFLLFHLPFIGTKCIYILKNCKFFMDKINPIVVCSMLVVYLTTLSSTKIKQHVMIHDSNELDSVYGRKWMVHN